MGLFSMFSKKNIEVEEKLAKKIEELEQTVLRKDKEISDLINELDGLNQNTVVNSNVNSKQLELIEKNLKESKEENDKLKQANDKLKQILAEYNLPFEREKYYYKVEIERFYSLGKFKELANALLDTGKKYLQDLNLEIFNKLSCDIKNLEEGKNRFQKYLKKEFIEWEVITYLNKGEKVSKIYSKNRKLLNVFEEKDIEFMEDLVKFDFSSLENLGFKKNQIDEFIEKRDEYYKERRVLV